MLIAEKARNDYLQGEEQCLPLLVFNNFSFCPAAFQHRKTQYPTRLFHAAGQKAPAFVKHLFDKRDSGKVMLRIPPELHAEIAMRAEASGKSLNQWAAETLSHA